MKAKFKFISCAFLVFIVLMSCAKEKPVFTVKTFEIEEGWGYAIYQHEKLIIKQECIPSISGQKHFKSEKDALTIGTLVVEKLKLHKSPSITPKELKNSISL